MPRIAEKLNFLTGAIVEVRHRIGNQPPNSYFCDHSGRRTFTKQPESLNLQDRLDILSKMRLSGVAEEIYIGDAR